MPVDQGACYSKHMDEGRIRREFRRMGAGLAAGACAMALASGLPLTAHATVYALAHPDDAVFGEDQTVVTVYEDTLYDLAAKYSLGSEELIRVNPGIDPWIPGAGKKIVIPGRHILPPGPHEGIVVNLPEHRLYYYPKPRRGQPQEVITYPVSIGKMDWRTPLGLTHVISKQKDPTWFPPESVRKEHAAAGDPLPAHVPPGPDNPLGRYAMRLAAGNGTYLIHGTNNPIAVGLPVTHVSRRCRRALSAGAGGHAGAPHQRADQGRLGGRGAVARSPSAGGRARAEL
jgi:lipoprotein-anchoring transpeptidase ErfK/SrfK